MPLSERLTRRRVAQRTKGPEAHSGPRPCGDQPRCAALVQAERPVLSAHRAADAVERARVPCLGAVESGGGDLVRVREEAAWVVIRQWSVVSGMWSVVGGQWSVVGSSQRQVVSRRCVGEVTWSWSCVLTNSKW